MGEITEHFSTVIGEGKEMSLHYYTQFQDIGKIDRLMKDVHYGTLPYISFIYDVKGQVEKERIGFNVKSLPQAPHYDELLNTYDKIEDVAERKRISALLNGHWYEVRETKKLETNPKLVDMVFSQKYVYPKYNEGQWLRDDRIEVLDSDQDRMLICLEKKTESKELFIRPNTIQYMRVLNAINKLVNTPSHYHDPLLRLFKTDRYEVDWPEFKPRSVEKYYFLDNLRSGADIQREFVEIALGTPDFAFLNGPPGTGKTQVICEIILQEIMAGKRVMLVASTHVAVDNVLERLMSNKLAKELVLPIRIGDKGKISRDSRQYMYKTLARTEQKRITRRLEEVNRSSSQETFYITLKEDDNVIMDGLLDIANLVCGTTIGIMKFPDIMNFQASKSRALFDVMILDEASKTPFYEFIVPAIWASKWILTGDPLQLSPYVDEIDVHTSLESVIEKLDCGYSDKVFALDTIVPYSRIRRPEEVRGNFELIIVEDPDLYDLHQRHLRSLKEQYPSLRVLVLEDLMEYIDNEMMVEVVLYGSQFVLSDPETISHFSEYVPKDFLIRVITSRGSPYDLIPMRLRRRNRIQPFEMDEDLSWIHQISYRLGRSYELRNDAKAQDRKKEEIARLIAPGDSFRNSIKQVEQVFFPSVLESLLEGFERRNQKWGSTITDGLPPDAREIRYRMLQYQHRMHPAISKFVRENIYCGESMQDAEDMGRIRQLWRDSPRVSWIDVHRKDRFRKKEPTDNPEEAEEVVRSLLEFIKWSKEKGNGREFTVAILTFYRAQERMIRKLLRSRLDQHNKIRHFSVPHVDIELCTVDRFQGHEADLVILSMVNNTRMGFLDSPNRLNVALSRAKYELMIIGKRQYFVKCRSELLRKLAKSTPRSRRY